MRLFGPSRLGWEGGMEGEGFLSLVKPILKGGLRKNWNINGMKKIIRTSSLHSLEKSNDLRGPLLLVAEELFRTPTEKLGFHFYKNKYEPLARFRANRPISGFISTSGEFLICCKTQKLEDGPTVLQILQVNHIKCMSGLDYHLWKLESSGEHIKSLESFKIQRAVLFLPELSGKGFFPEEQGVDRGIYTVIDEEWLVLNRELKFTLPTAIPWVE
jgi:hypothetical protein